MSEGATDRNKLASIEQHIAKAEERIAELYVERDLTPNEKETLQQEEIFLEYLCDQRQIILANWRTKHTRLIATR